MGEGYGGTMSMWFEEFPEDVQVCILSFLGPTDLSAFCCTSRKFARLSRADSRAWLAMCLRRWSPLTRVRDWGAGRVSFRLLFTALSELDALIGFWRPGGGGGGDGGGSPHAPPPPPLVVFEWGPSCVVGSRVSPSKDGSYGVVKSPFMWMSLSPEGERVNLVKHPDDPNLTRVSVSFLGQGHLIVEEIRDFCGGCNNNNNSNGSDNNASSENGAMRSPVGSPGEGRGMTEMYEYLANRRSPGSSGERAWRRQRRREKERQGARRKWEPEHLVKIVHCSPTPSRPLQGLWKGICDAMTLDFYLVTYDSIGGVACRRLGDCSKPFSVYAPIFWTSNAVLIESPLSHEEDYLYNTRMHIRPVAESGDDFPEHSPSHIMYISSSYDLVVPDLAGTSANPRHVEGRIWRYVDGTFGFGFLRNNFIVDLKHIAKNGSILDAVEPCSA